MPTTEILLRAENVSKTFGVGSAATVALTEVDLAVRAGEFVTIVGASGCGKSTLLNLYAGIDKPTSGTIEVNGKVALMFQEAILLPWLTARGNIELALRYAGVPRSDRDARIAELLTIVRLGDRHHSDTEIGHGGTGHPQSEGAQRVGGGQGAEINAAVTLRQGLNQ
jgi:NitT/TauT family transport system ATP-binding protein